MDPLLEQFKSGMEEELARLKLKTQPTTFDSWRIAELERILAEWVA